MDEDVQPAPLIEDVVAADKDPVLVTVDGMLIHNRWVILLIYLGTF